MEFWTALAFARQKAWAEAIEHFTAAEVIAQATEPERLNQVFYFEVGAACERKGDYVQAEKYFEKCLNLAPDDAEAQNYLGYMYAEQGMKLDRAKELVQKAVRSEPKNPAYLDSLGWILFKLRQPQEALGYILKALELSEKPDPTLYDHLGDIYVALDQLDKARDAWRKSIALDPDSRVLGKLESSGPR
jgi:tetratricopeptide (TPR) repeat protein